MADPTPPTGHIPSWELPSVQGQEKPSAATEPTEETTYLPLSSTLRLYAGWLLAWYAAVYVLGSFQQAGLLPWAPEFIANLYASPLTLLFTCATFLFLLLGTVQRATGGGVLKGITLTIAGIALFYGFWLYA